MSFRRGLFIEWTPRAASKIIRLVVDHAIIIIQSILPLIDIQRFLSPWLNVRCGWVARLRSWIWRRQKHFKKIIFPECANTEQFRTAGSRIKIFGLDFYQLTEESNPGRLGEKRERYLCAMPSPQEVVGWISVFFYFPLRYAPLV